MLLEIGIGEVLDGDEKVLRFVSSGGKLAKVFSGTKSVRLES